MCEFFFFFFFFFFQEGSGACQHPDLKSLTSICLSIGAGKKSQGCALRRSLNGYNF